MIKWLRNEFTKTPGYMRVNLSLLTTLAISSVTSTSLLIRQQVRSTSAENTLYRNESPREERERSQANPIGKSITDPPQSSKPTYPSSERKISPERSYPYIEPLERQTMRKQDNSF